MGSGLICSDFVQALRSAKGCAVTAVGARRIESARKFADANGIKLAFGSYDELVACSDVDIVYIGTIHPTHKKLAIMAMRAGKHVLCEKPMTICKADTAELFAVADECGVLLVEALWTRFFPTVAKAREIAADKLVEVEVETLDELHQALAARADVVMLDNFSPADIEALSSIDLGETKIEVSGDITEEKINAYSHGAVDFISSGSITKHIRAVDLSMRLVD